MGAFDFVFGEPHPELRHRRQVQVEVSVRAAAFRRRHAAASSAAAVAALRPAVVVAALVPSQGLPRGEAPVAYGALVRLPAGEGRRRSTGGGGGGVVDFGAVEPAVAGLVPSQGLVGGKSLVADGTFVDQFRRVGRCLRRWRKMRLLLRGFDDGSGGGSRGRTAASEHDEAESQVFFFGGVVLGAGALGALALAP